MLTFGVGEGGQGYGSSQAEALVFPIKFAEHREELVQHLEADSHSQHACLN